MRTALALAFSAGLASSAAYADGHMTTLPDNMYVLPSSSASVIPMAAWDDGGMVKSAAGSDASMAPATAVAYTATEANWPTARVRAMRFDADTGGVLHPITDETLLYMLRGSAQVQVGDEIVTAEEGDVVSFPSGVLRNAGRASDATIITWTAPSLTGEETPTHVRGADVNMGGGGAISLKRYEFPGNSVRAVWLAAGGSTNPNSAPTDSLIYVTAGPMTFFQNGVAFVVNEGDFIREIAGLQHNWSIQEDSGFVTTSGKPLDMDTINPDEATDRPPER